MGQTKHYFDHLAVRVCSGILHTQWPEKRGGQEELMITGKTSTDARKRLTNTSAESTIEAVHARAQLCVCTQVYMCINLKNTLDAKRLCARVFRVIV